MPLVDLNGLGYFKGKENAMIADNYSATATYKQGDFCYYNGTLKKAKQDIDTAEAWTSAHWEDAILGDDVTTLKNALTFEVNSSSDIWQNYSISSSTGEDGSSSSTRLSTIDYLDNAIKAITVDSGYQYAIYVYNASKTYQGILQNDLTYATSANWRDAGTFYMYQVPSNYYYRLLIRTQTNGAISPSDNTHFRFLYATDTSLLKSGVPADAKTTGDAVAQIASTWFLNGTDATEITTGTNYDNLKTVGNYRCSVGSNASGMTNCPVSSAHRLIVMKPANNNARLLQIVTVQASTCKEFRRFFDGSSWTDWKAFVFKDDVTYFSNTILTSDDYTTYFANGLLSDAEPNTIWGIYDTSLFSDAPIGNGNIGAGGSDGGMRGTLYTFSQAESHDKVQSGLTQLFVGYRDSGYKPVFCYRIAIKSDNSYVWSEWSKFEQDGFLHATNTFIYAGHLDESISDLNDAPSNSIMQIDLNMNGSDADHTLGNHPAPGVSCVVITYAFSYSSPHGKVQEVYTIDGRRYWRYGYKQNSETYIWTGWRYNPNLPEAPTTDGTYTLKVTVSSGSPTYSWVADS